MMLMFLQQQHGRWQDLPNNLGMTGTTVEHCAASISKIYDQIADLRMEQDEKRRSELDVMSQRVKSLEERISESSLKKTFRYLKGLLGFR